MAAFHDRSSDSPPDASGLTRRELLPLLGAAGMTAIVPSALADDGNHRRPSARARYVYVGTYTAPGTPPGGTHPSVALGIYVFRMDPHDGDLAPLQVVQASNPSYLALHPTLARLYSVNEDLAGRVSAYRIDGAGQLHVLNSASADGQHTTHLSVHPSGQFLMAANYSTGNYPGFRLNADGSIGAKTADFQGVGNGTGPHADRQEGPHAHQIVSDFDAKHVFGVDLGADRVNVLNLDLVSGALSPNTVPFANSASGGGPRHMAFHPDRQHAYVLNELTSSIDAHRYDPVRGAFVWLQTISTLPRHFSGGNTTAEIRVHPSGRFLYNTNRGHNSVAKFEIDRDSGKLESIGWETSGGQWPRGMNIDPSGTFLYVGNQNTDTILVYRIKHNGDLQRSALVRTPTPVDIAFGAVIA
jgi:6-phosphogluconolactonase